mgnify:CR=1 FL=1
MKQLSLARMGALALAISAMSGAYAADTKSVAVTAIVEHPALDAVRDGVKDGKGGRGACTATVWSAAPHVPDGLHKSDAPRIRRDPGRVL